MPSQRVTVPREARGERLDRFLTRSLPGVAPERVRQLIESGHVRIGGKACQATRKLWGGEEIEVASPAPRAVAAPEGPQVPILYQDADLVIVDKPAGLVVELEPQRPSVVGLLAARLGGFDVGGLAAPGVVHRLDRETSGCLMLARHDAALAALKQAFDEHRVEKRYWAFVLGEPPASGRIETPYGRDPKDARRFTTRVASARRAALSFEKREQFKDAAWLEVKLETGRTHQIRVQLAEAGYPVLGDAIYGRKEVRTHPVAVAIGRHALHAYRLAVQRAETIAVEAPLPADLAQGLALLRSTQ